MDTFYQMIDRAKVPVTVKDTLWELSHAIDYNKVVINILERLRDEQVDKFFDKEDPVYQEVVDDLAAQRVGRGLVHQWSITQGKEENNT